MQAVLDTGQKTMMGACKMLERLGSTRLANRVSKARLILVSYGFANIWQNREIKESVIKRFKQRITECCWKEMELSSPAVTHLV